MVLNKLESLFFITNMNYKFINSLFFPHPMTVRGEGVLGIQGDLSMDRLLLAYNYGIFPWYNEGDPIIWWCPVPRFVIFPEKVKVAKSMRTYFNNEKYRVTYNEYFEDIIQFCRYTPRLGQSGTWITDEIIESYINLHYNGYATSVEVWENDDLVGGLYGVNIGKVFFGESMFSLKSNASKFGFISLANKLHAEGYVLIDCQQPNDYLKSLGGEFISGDNFHSILRKNRLLFLEE